MAGDRPSICQRSMGPPFLERQFSFPTLRLNLVLGLDDRFRIPGGAFGIDGGNSGSDCGHRKLALLIPGRPGYQHRFPSMIRQDQYSLAAGGNSVLQLIALDAVAAHDRTMATMATMRYRSMVRGENVLLGRKVPHQQAVDRRRRKGREAASIPR